MRTRDACFPAVAPLGIFERVNGRSGRVTLSGALVRATGGLA